MRYSQSATQQRITWRVHRFDFYENYLPIKKRTVQRGRNEGGKQVDCCFRLIVPYVQNLLGTQGTASLIFFSRYFVDIFFKKRAGEILAVRRDEQDC